MFCISESYFEKENYNVNIEQTQDYIKMPLY